MIFNLNEWGIYRTGCSVYYCGFLLFQRHLQKGLKMASSTSQRELQQQYMNLLKGLSEAIWGLIGRAVADNVRVFVFADGVHHRGELREQFLQRHPGKDLLFRAGSREEITGAEREGCLVVDAENLELAAFAKGIAGAE